MTVDRDKLLRADAMLRALREHLPDSYDVEEKWAMDFNVMIDRISSTSGVDLVEFKIDEQEFHRSEAGYNTITEETTYRPGLWCRRSRLLMKLDAALNYFAALRNGAHLGMRHQE